MEEGRYQTHIRHIDVSTNAINYKMYYLYFQFTMKSLWFFTKNILRNQFWFIISFIFVKVKFLREELPK